METLLRLLARWKARRRSAQIIVFDGGAEVDRTRSFLRGALTGIALTTLVFVLAAPADTDPGLVDQVGQRELLLRRSNAQLDQAVRVADACLETAERMDEAIESYEAILGSRAAARARTLGTAAPAPAP